MSTYSEFVASKVLAIPPVAEREAIAPEWDLFPWQSFLVERALQRGRSALFADTGTGKTRMELAWAQAVAEASNGPVLLLAPLAVSAQIEREAKLLGADARYSAGEMNGAAITVSNYERLHHFKPECFAGVVLDESSILKSLDGKTRRDLTAFAESIAYRLCATATPAPNDYIELGQHAEFLGVLTAKEMMALYFTQDGNSTTQWRMKRHAADDFWRWVASWAMAMRKPSDIGFPEGDALYELPPLRVSQVQVEAEHDHFSGTLFRDEARTLSERREARRDTLEQRVAAAVELVDAEPDEQWLIWTDLNAESEALADAIPRAIEVRGSDSAEYKASAMLWFAGNECLCRNAAFRSKLEAWRNFQSDPTPSTCEPTTAPTNTSGSDARASSRTPTTQPAEQSTPPTRGSASAPSMRPGGGAPRTQTLTSPAAFASTGSPPTSIGPSSRNKAAVALSVGDHSARTPTIEAASRADSTSITTTPAAKFEASSAQDATWESASLGTIPSGLSEPQCICGHASGSRILISKSSICGFGMNFQSCSRMIFVGLSDSFERYYQAVRRCWRFGQTREVHAYIVTADVEGAVVRNIENKQRKAESMADELVQAMSERTVEHLARGEYETDDAQGDGWRVMLGDCIERLAEVEDETVGLSVFSPPFPSMYVYTDQARDMGNVQSVEQMIEHFGFLVPELLRVLMPGRSVLIHLAQAQTRKRDGDEIGLKDFRGATIQAMERGGFTYYGEVTIDKDPQVKAIRTKDRGLLFKTLAHDSALMRMAQADYLLQFRKPGENPEPITAGLSERYNNTTGWITPEEWIEWASPVWYRAGDGYPGGIRETDVLNVAVARDAKDERHLCPLQLGVIERAVKLWSAPGDLVLSPFTGVGSEGVRSVELGRRFIGVELKRSYFETAVRNVRHAAETAGTQTSIFDALESEAVA